MTRKEQLLKISYTLTSCEETAEKFAQHLEELFDVLVPERIGPAFVAALQANDYAEAVKQCAAYYREKAPCGVPSLMAKKQPDIEEADKAVAGKIRVVNVDWEFPDGELDYYFDPTMIHGPRNYEWVWQFNRHGFWPCMANTYYATGDEKYAAAFSRQMLKWVAQTYISKDYNDVGSA